LNTTVSFYQGIEIDELYITFKSLQIIIPSYKMVRPSADLPCCSKLLT